MPKQIIVEIGDGKIDYETKGIKGSTCTKESAWLDELFGAENLVEEKKTAEYYQVEVEKAKVRIKR
jgi:hypothetical protein